jgi:hypothetical protein
MTKLFKDKIWLNFFQEFVTMLLHKKPGGGAAASAPGGAAK